MDGWSVFRVIAGRMVGLFANLLIRSMDDQCQLIFLLSGLLSGRSVKPSDWLAISNYPPTIHLSDRLPTIQSHFFYKRSVLEFHISRVWLIPVSLRLFGCGGAAWPMPESRWSSVGSVSSLGYTSPRLEEHSLDRSGNTSTIGKWPLVIQE